MPRILKALAAAAVVSVLPLSANAVMLTSADLPLTGPIRSNASVQPAVTAEMNAAGEIFAVEFAAGSSSGANTGSTVAPPLGLLVGDLQSVFNDTPDRVTPFDIAQNTDAEGLIISAAMQAGSAIGSSNLDPHYLGTPHDGLSDPDDRLALAVSAVPLPASLLMLFGALGGLGYLGHARRRRSDAAM